MGIDEAYISLLVDTFYERIRDHAVLGPIFAEKIGDNWGPHLARMKDFWASVALNAGRAPRSGFGSRPTRSWPEAGIDA